MKFAGKRLLFVDIETSGLPMARKSVRRFDKYVSPDINIAYDKSRLLSMSIISDSTTTWYRNTSDLTDDAYTTNKGKYGNMTKHTITQLLSESLVHFKKCDYAIGHNVLFDLHIIANEFHRAGDKDGYAIVMAIINESRYFCTLMMAKMIGIDDKDIDLKSMVERFTSNSSTYKFHESCDDVAATKLVFESGITKLHSIPPVVDDITDRIYPPIVFGELTKLPVYVTMKVNRTAFHHYVDLLKPLAYRYFVSGKFELRVSEEQRDSINPHHLMTLDGQCFIDGKHYDTRYIIDTMTYNCDVCNTQMLGIYICSSCIDDSAFRYAEGFTSIEADFNDTTTAAELKARLKDIKGKARRSGVLPIETQKKGRSLVVPLNKVEFYLEKRLYEHFSIKVGSAKM